MRLDSFRLGRRGTDRYRLIAHILRMRILQGEFDDQVLPTERFMTEQFGVSRETVRRALQELVSEGLIYRVHGSGTFVRPQATRNSPPTATLTDVLPLRTDTSVEVKTEPRRLVDASMASRLGQDFSAIWTLSLRRLHQGRIVCQTDVYLPQRVGAALYGGTEQPDSGLRPKEPVIDLIQTNQFDVFEVEQMITATTADEELARTFAGQRGMPLLHVEHTYRDYGGEALEIAISDSLPGYVQHPTRLARCSMPTLMPRGIMGRPHHLGGADLEKLA